MTNPSGQNPAQPTGKRQLRGASPVSTEGQDAKRVPVADANAEDKSGSSVATFPGEVVSEMKKVIWPTGRQMLNYTLIVFAFLLVLTVFVWGVDALSSCVIRWIFIR